MKYERFYKLAAASFLALGLSISLSGCGSTSVAQGNFGLAKTMITGQIQDDVYKPGFTLGLISNINEYYGREDMIKIENIHPKDKDNVLLRDLDLVVTFVSNPAKAKDFIIKTNDVQEIDKVAHIGRVRIDRDARNIIGESVRKFGSLDILNDPKVLEAQFKSDLQTNLDKEYGKGVFEIKDIKTSNILVAEALESRIQSIALIDAEMAKNNAIIAILKNRGTRLTAEAKIIKDAATESGITVDQLLQSQMIDAIKEGAVHAQVTVPMNITPKMK
jgi:hypothetical protein